MEVCSSCHGGCCRKYYPDVTGYDLLKISRLLALDINFFATATPADPNYLKLALGKKPLFLFTDSREEKYYRVCLKIEESELFPESYKCIFLREWDTKAENSKKFSGIIARCSIYDARPYTCRVYPAKFDENEKKGIILDPYKLFSKEEQPAYALCPRELISSDYKAGSDELLKNLLMYDYEMAFFLQLSEEWNKNPNLSDYFIDFMIKKYQNRVEHIKS